MKKKNKLSIPKGLFMKVTVVFCIAYVVRIIERGLDICESQSISPTSIVTATITFFGAELVMCVVKKIMSSKTNEEIQSDGSETPRKLNNDLKIPLG